MEDGFFFSFFSSMKKDFELWNRQKQQLEMRQPTLFFREGEIWWASLGINVVVEICGKGEHFNRPVLILKKLSRESCIVLPLTSKKKQGSWFREVYLLGEKRWVLLHQIRLISVQCLQREAGLLSKEDFINVKKKLKTLLKLL